MTTDLALQPPPAEHQANEATLIEGENAGVTEAAEIVVYSPGILEARL